MIVDASRDKSCQSGSERAISTEDGPLHVSLERLPSLLEGCRVNKGFNGPRGRFGMTRKYLEFHPLPSRPSRSSCFPFSSTIPLNRSDSDRERERESVDCSHPMVE